MSKKNLDNYDVDLKKNTNLVLNLIKSQFKNEEQTFYHNLRRFFFN